MARAVGLGELGTAFMEIRSPASKVKEWARLVSMQEVAEPIMVQERVESSPFFRTVNV
jgi:hypothetical protein